ncbi:MAG: hypothetical protein K0R52_174 [Alphaproteobacteria bacterium]|jgi:hypothetical protein|nr:hypothetical protein [Alphaproteobacteria bacterium]
MPKSIINNNDLLDGNILSQELETTPASLSNLFMFDFQEFSSKMYVFKGEDLDHQLLCEMTLKLKETFVSVDEEEEGGKGSLRLSSPVISPALTCKNSMPK